MAGRRPGYGAAVVEFEEALERLGFVLAEERSGGRTRLFRADPNRFLAYWVHAFDDGTALFTWEFAIVDYLAERGMQIGSGESLNTFLFPAQDERGPQDAAWLASAIDRAESRLRALRFDDPDL
jgi:hypothetical protein